MSVTKEFKIYLVDGRQELFDPRIVAEYMSYDQATGTPLPRSTAENLRNGNIINSFHAPLFMYLGAAVMRMSDTLDSPGNRDILYRYMEDQDFPLGLKRQSWRVNTATRSGREIVENQLKIFLALQHQERRGADQTRLRTTTINRLSGLLK